MSQLLNKLDALKDTVSAAIDRSLSDFSMTESEFLSASLQGGVWLGKKSDDVYIARYIGAKAVDISLCEEFNTGPDCRWNQCSSSRRSDPLNADDALMLEIKAHECGCAFHVVRLT